MKFKSLVYYIRFIQKPVFRNIPFKEYFQKEPIYIFHHIPKCGGTSLKEILSNWFLLISDYRPNYHNDDSLFLKNRHPLERFKTYKLLSGHFERDGNYLLQRYPEASQEKVKVFTVLRDPLSVRISLYYHERKLGFNKDFSLEEFLFYENNWISKRFPCNEEITKK